MSIFRFEKQISIISNDMNLRIFQCKLLHHILPTTSKLLKMRIKDSSFLKPVQ